MPVQALEGKGQKGERCNVMACQKAKSADYYNTATKAWYCLHCAAKINASFRYYNPGEDLFEYTNKHKHLFRDMWRWQ